MPETSSVMSSANASMRKVMVRSSPSTHVSSWRVGPLLSASSTPAQMAVRRGATAAVSRPLRIDHRPANAAAATPITCAANNHQIIAPAYAQHQIDANR